MRSKEEVRHSAYEHERARTGVVGTALQYGTEAS